MGQSQIQPQIQLAAPADARWIAEFSRDYIEAGLGWRWQRATVIKEINDPEINVITARQDGEVAGFAIMTYQGFEAHLILFAVAPAHRRKGIGTALIAWLTRTAEVAGVQAIFVELRKNNAAARAFYEALGFKLLEPLPNYYQDVEAGLRMALDLRRRDTAER